MFKKIKIQQTALLFIVTINFLFAAESALFQFGVVSIDVLNEKFYTDYLPKDQTPMPFKQRYDMLYQGFSWLKKKDRGIGIICTQEWSNGLNEVMSINSPEGGHWAQVTFQPNQQEGFRAFHEPRTYYDSDLFKEMVNKKPISLVIEKASGKIGKGLLVAFFTLKSDSRISLGVINVHMPFDENRRQDALNEIKKVVRSNQEIKNWILCGNFLTDNYDMLYDSLKQEFEASSVEADCGKTPTVWTKEKGYATYDYIFYSNGLKPISCKIIPEDLEKLIKRNPPYGYGAWFSDHAAVFMRFSIQVGRQEPVAMQPHPSAARPAVPMPQQSTSTTAATQTPATFATPELNCAVIVDVPAFIKDQLVAVQKSLNQELNSSLKQYGLDFTYLPPHITLVYLEPMAITQLNTLENTLINTLKSQRGTIMIDSLTGPELFGQHNEFVICRVQSHQLRQLYDIVEKSLKQQGIKMKPFDFNPHISLGKIKIDDMNKLLKDINSSKKFDIHTGTNKDRVVVGSNGLYPFMRMAFNRVSDLIPKDPWNIGSIILSQMVSTGPKQLMVLQ